MSYLITGGAGFVGSMLVRQLVSQRENVHVILRKQSKIWRLNDIIDKVTIHISDLSSVSDLIKIVKKAKPHVIYHLSANGAYSYQKDADQIIHTNIVGTWNLLQACNTIDYNLFVNTGSSSEYGFKKCSMRETDLLEPASYYAVTKCTQTLLCSHIAKQENRPIVTLRPFSVYGPYEEPKRFIPTLMKSLFYKEDMQLVTPTTARDYVYVDDVIDAYLKIDELKHAQGEYFNIGTGVQSTIKEVVNTAQKVTGIIIKFQWGSMKNRKWDTDTWVADISKARLRLKWIPKISLVEGLTKTWEWFQQNSHYYS